MTSTPHPGDEILVRDTIGTFYRMCDDAAVVLTNDYLEITDTWLRCSQHAMTMLRSRSNTHANGLVLWQDAIVVSEPHGMDAHEVRYHDEADVFLLRRNNTIVTAIQQTTARQQARDAI